MPIKGRNCDTLNKISETFRPFVKEILKDLNFGLCRSKVQFEKFRSSLNDKNSLADQFTVVLPYAGNCLRWDILFDSNSPWFAPDFRFDDESFLSNIDADFIHKHIPSLSKWDDNDPKALSHVLTELMVLYREHQKCLLEEDKNSRAYFEYTALIGDSNTLENDIEILVCTGDTVYFMIRLNVDCTQLAALFDDDINENPGGECAVLLVKYPNPNIAELIMSPLVKRAVGDITLPHIHQTAVLMDYVPMTTKIINKKIALSYQNKKLRHEMLSRFIVKYEGCVLEHDSTTASFLFEIDDFYCIFQIAKGMNFPEKPPLLTLRSVYHYYRGKPHTKVLELCPYEKIQSYVMQQIEIFKEECISNSINPSGVV